MLTGGDVRAERNRHTPVVTQDELQEEMGWKVRGVAGLIENGEIEATQPQLQKMLDTIERIVARRTETT